MPLDFDPAITPLTRQRRPEHARDDAFAVALLARATVGQVATRWDAQPCLTPTTFWYDAAGHQLYFHSSHGGRLRASIERHPEVAFCATEVGAPLPSNHALELSIQYRSVVAFGTARIVTESDEARRALAGLVAKHFPALHLGREIRPITDAELRRTTVYAMTITEWSAKENWPDAADQGSDWPPLPG